MWDSAFLQLSLLCPRNQMAYLYFPKGITLAEFSVIEFYLEGFKKALQAKEQQPNDYQI